MPVTGDVSQGDKNSHNVQYVDNKRFALFPVLLIRDSLNPDPAFQVNPDTDPDLDPIQIRIQSGFGSNPDLDPIWIQGFDEKKFFNPFFDKKNLQFTYP
jgi:hypothetical protein